MFCIAGSQYYCYEDDLFYLFIVVVSLLIFSSRLNSATTAAPTFFTPVQWEGGLFCDGALVANNPTAIALQEAKVHT